MISLLANSQIREYDILTIQKFWRNVCVSTSYNSFSIDFHLLYEMKENVRVCFYVNTKLNVNSWSIDFVSSDMCTLKLDLNDQRIVNIHNVYNVSSVFYASNALLFIIETTQDRLVVDEEHVLLENFNLHHSLWCDPTRSTQHTAIDQLIDLLVSKHMNLCLSQRIVTWEAKNSHNIIDLIFMIERLQASITHCENRRDLNQSSNHISISTILMLKIEQTSVRERRAWKKIDSERLAFCLRSFVVSASFNNVNDIETFVREIQLSVQSIIQEAIFMIRESERAQLFWSSKCSEIVATIRRRRREWSSRRTEKSWKTYLKFIDVKKKVIVKKKKLEFRKIFEKLTAQTASLWRLVRWAKSQSHRSKKIFKVSNLIQKNSLEETTRIVKNFENKAIMLTKQFFSETVEADLSDMTSFSYRDVVVKTTFLISENEIRQTIKRYKLDSVSSSNEISNRILKALTEKLFSLLTSLFRACVEHDYHSLCFREVNIIALKKSNKSNYTDFKTYRLIALLNTIDKALESIIARRISTLAETHEMLFATQMKRRRKRVCETTLKLFIEQIHTIWNMSRNKMTTLLSMNVASAYDHVSRERLMHNLRKKEISNWIVTWTSSFMRDRHITLAIDDDTTFMRRINADISQDSSISFIFYLFYNADILKSLKRSRYKIIAIEFVNDINILTYETSTKSNCRALEKAHVECELWARRHEARFASTKYELMHLTRNHRRFNMTTIININEVIKKSFISMRVLEVQLDIKLKWDSHVKKIHEKMTTQMLALTRLTASTWEACFKKTRHVYTAVVRSIITYEFSTWHVSHERSNSFMKLIKNFIDLQKQDLRTVCDAFKTISHQLLDVETQISLIELHLTLLQTKTRMRLHEKEHNVFTKAHCDKIKRKLTIARERRRRAADETSRERKRKWFDKLCAKKERVILLENRLINKTLKKLLSLKWKRIWDEYQTTNERRVCVTLTFRIFKKRLKLHDKLFKAESSLITQMRIDRIDLTNYLFHRKILTIVSSTCSCDWLKQITKHIILFCSNHHIYRDSMLRVVETQNYSMLLDTAKDLRKAVRWLMKTNLLTQFFLASKCLEWFSSAKTAKRVITDTTEWAHNTSSSKLNADAQTTSRKKFFVSLEVFLS